MHLEPLFESLLLILQLGEFMGPKQLCFLIKLDDQSLQRMSRVGEIFRNNYVCTMTCERLVDCFHVVNHIVQILQFWFYYWF